MHSAPAWWLPGSCAGLTKARHVIMLGHQPASTTQHQFYHCDQHYYYIYRA